MKLFQELLTFFYEFNKYESNPYYLFKPEILQNFITSLFFEDNISTLIETIQRKADRQLNDQLNVQLNVLSKYQPQDFEIPDKFCLNERTEKWIEEKRSALRDEFRRIRQNETGNEEIREKEDDLLSSQRRSTIFRAKKDSEESLYFLSELPRKVNNPEKLKGLIGTSENDLQRWRKEECYSDRRGEEDRWRQEEIEALLEEEPSLRREFFPEEETLRLCAYTPYQLSIRTLGKVSRYKKPLHKLKQIWETAKSIIREISEFYARRGGFPERNMIGEDGTSGILGGDELLAIMVFIVARVRLENLRSDCAIVDAFITSDMENSVSGYYLVTVQVCLGFLAGFKGK
jgi:hypothetical protein